MYNCKRAVCAAIAALTVSILLSTAAEADNSEDPCGLAMAFLCRLVPMMPELDHDVDLSQDQPPADSPPAPP